MNADEKMEGELEFLAVLINQQVKSLASISLRHLDMMRHQLK
jgi:hypothetical protein